MFDKHRFAQYNEDFKKGNTIRNIGVNILHFKTKEDYEEFKKDFPAADGQINSDVKEGRTLVRISAFYDDGSIVINTGDRETYDGCNIYTYKEAKEAFKMVDFTTLMI